MNVYFNSLFDNDDTLLSYSAMFTFVRMNFSSYLHEMDKDIPNRYTLSGGRRSRKRKRGLLKRPCYKIYKKLC